MEEANECFYRDTSPVSSVEEKNGSSFGKVKSLERDKPVSPFLAALVDSACTSKCDIELMMKKYKIPENCEKLCAPITNEEIWNKINVRARSYDKAIFDIQNMLAASMIPLFKLAELMKDHIIQSSEAQTLLADIITMSCQVQYNMSVRRRLQIRPHLSKQYTKLCKTDMPITSYLFGDDVQNDIQTCEDQTSKFIQKNKKTPSSGKDGSNKKRGSATPRYSPYLHSTGLRGREASGQRGAGRGSSRGRGDPGDSVSFRGRGNPVDLNSFRGMGNPRERDRRRVSPRDCGSYRGRGSSRDSSGNCDRLRGWENPYTRENCENKSYTNTSVFGTTKKFASLPELEEFGV